MPDRAGKENLRDLAVFHDVARALTSTLELDEILGTILKQMQQYFQPESWTLLMLDEVRNELVYVIAAGRTKSELEDLRVPAGEGMAGWVVEHGETLIIPEVADDPRFAESVHDGQFRIRSAISLPLRSRRRTLGVIQLLNCNMASLSDYAISFVHILCDYAAIAIENARAVQRIQELTITDEVTGLNNVRHLYTTLQSEINRSKRSRRPFSLIFIDIDHFKRVNDTYGHLSGSKLLGEIGRFLRQQVRGIDLCFRYGGDEFVVLMPEAGKEEALQATLRLREDLKQHAFLSSEDLGLHVTASFGVATHPEEGKTLHQIIGMADARMYSVKRGGRDNVAAAGQLVSRN